MDDIETPRSICGELFDTEDEVREHEEECRDCTAQTIAALDER
jgi:hypothetical protein